MCQRLNIAVKSLDADACDVQWFIIVMDFQNQAEFKCSWISNIKSFEEQEFQRILLIASASKFTVLWFKSAFYRDFIISTFWSLWI